MVLSEIQKKEFLVLLSHAFIEIRSLCRVDGTQEQRAKAFEIADRLHNIPKLISGKNVDHTQLLCEINILDDSYRQEALNIIKMT